MPCTVDAVLALFVPQLLAYRSVMNRVATALRPGGWIVASGIKRSEGCLELFWNLVYLLLVPCMAMGRCKGCVSSFVDKASTL